MAFIGPGSVDSRTGSHTSREIQPIIEVEEFTAEPAQAATAALQGSPEPAATAVTPRSKSSLAKKLAKTLGFSSHPGKASSSDGSAANPGSQQANVKSITDNSQQQLDKSVHFGNSAVTQQTAVQDTALPKFTGSADVMLIGGNAAQPSKVVSPFQSISDQAGKTESVTFYSPSPSFSSVLSTRPSKAMSSNLDEEASQARRSPLGLPNPAAKSGELETRKSRSMLEQNTADERTVSGGLAIKSRRSSLTYSVKSSGNSETDSTVLARANSENPWGPRRSVGSFTSGKGDSSPRLRGAYAEMQIKDMEQQLSDARTRIVQFTAEVQASKQVVEQREERAASLQAQLDELKQAKDSPIKSVMDKLSATRSEANTLAEQLNASKRDAELQHKENQRLQKALAEQQTGHQQALAAMQKDAKAHQDAAQAAQTQLQEENAALKQQCSSYEVVLKHQDTKGQLMSLQQTLRQEIHAKIGAQTAEESAKRRVSELQGSVQELQEALEQETAANRDSQATLKEAFHHRQTLEASIHALERQLAQAQASSKPADKPDLHLDSDRASAPTESREAGTNTSAGSAPGSGSADTLPLRQQVHDLEAALAEANNRLTRIDEADKRLGPSPSSKALPPPQKAGTNGAGTPSMTAPAQPAPLGKPVQAQPSHDAPKPEAAPKSDTPIVQKQNISWRRISVDDDRVDAVISHLEDMNSTLKSLRSEGGDLEPYVGSLEDMAAELEKERTNRIIAQQAANQEKLQARASAAESASLRRQLKELAERLAEDKQNEAGPVALRADPEDAGEHDSDGMDAAARYRAAQQVFTRDAASSPMKAPLPGKVGDTMREGESQDSFEPPSGLETPASEAADEQTGDAEPTSTAAAASEQSYTDTIQNLLSELWKERLARQRAELTATDAHSKLKAVVWATESNSGQEKQRSKALADVDASLMQRLDQETADNQRLLEAVKSTQGGSQVLQDRVKALEAALQRQDSQLEKLQAGAKRHLESTLRQSTTRKNLQQATQKEDKLRQHIARLETELAASRRQQRDQAAHSHASSKQAEDELVERQAELSQLAARLAHESEQRRHLEALLDEGLQVQTQILVGLQEVVKYLREEQHVEGQASHTATQPPNLDQLINLLQRSQTNSRTALGWTSARVGRSGRPASSPSRTRSSLSQRAGNSLSGTLEEGTPPVELGSSPPGSADPRKPAWIVPGSRTGARAAARKEARRASSPFENTASRYRNPRSTPAREAQPDNAFRARSVPRGMSPQRSRVAEYIRAASPIISRQSTQVMPATRSDMAARQHELISARHSGPINPQPQPSLAPSDADSISKPASLLTKHDSGSQGSFQTYSTLQSVQSASQSLQGGPRQGKWDNRVATWGKQEIAGQMHVRSGSSRHTHQE